QAEASAAQAEASAAQAEASAAQAEASAAQERATVAEQSLLAEQSRSTKLAEKLRELGINPDSV
ncbi:MAG: Uma2 family endonuclease, partial [Cyanobacteria bacterium J06554_3]